MSEQQTWQEYNTCYLIHNVALNAAYVAAHAGIPVNMELVMRTGRTEFHKLDRSIVEADFKWQALAAKEAPWEVKP